MDEPALRALWESGDRQAFVTAVIQTYGREILSYLIATLRGEGEAGDAFSQFSLNLWQASAAFRGTSSARTWAYALARHAVGRTYRERTRARRQVPLSGVPEVDAAAARVRSDTLQYLRTETRDRVSQLRDELEPDDQTILILRVDRGFTWPEIARVMGEMGDGEAPSDKEIAALRKRFERIKDRLRKKALALGQT